MGTRNCVILLGALSAGAIQAGELELKPETLKAWDEYVKKVDPATLRHANPEREAKIRSGEILVSAASNNAIQHVPDGLIHDWVGEAFISNTTIDQVLSVVRDYSRYKDIYKPGVINAKLLRQSPGKDEFTLMMRNMSYFKKTAIEGLYECTYVRPEPGKLYSITNTTRMQEVEDYGTPEEHRLPVDRGHGYIWRFHSVAMLEERDGGVYFDLRAIALSRDLPAAIRWVASPIIKRVARESLAESMQKTRTAVESRPTVISDAARAGLDEHKAAAR